MENTTEKELHEELDKEECNKNYKILKLRLDELKRRKKGKFPLYSGIVTAILSSLIFCLFVFDNFYNISTIHKICFSVLIGTSFGVVLALYFRMLLDIQESQVRRKMLEYEVENTRDEVEEDIFENSIKMSYKYLDQYYLQTREQAQRGFFVTVGIAIFGAILIGAGIIAMFFEKTNPSYVTCASGVVTEFISAIFFYLYNKTIASMSKYHNKLVLSQNISIALKVADTLPSDDKTKAKNIIINELLKDVNSYLIKNDDENRKSDELSGQKNEKP